jgi:hypothetical protein
MGKFRALWTIAIVVIAVLAIVVCLNHAVLAQGTSAGSIKGIVTDASGAVMSGVAVTVTNAQTNRNLTFTTDADGRYYALNLPVSSYSVKAEKSGFGTKISENVQVNPGIDTVLDIQMVVGTVDQTVDVRATIAPVTEDKPDRGVVISAGTLQTLPLQVSGGQRQSDTFLTLAPGVTGDTFSARINGAPNFSQDFYYDGIPYMNGDGGGRQEGLGVPFEAVDEYAIHTNAYSAVYGRGSGLLNFHIKNGNNQLHGGAWEFLRNDALDAPGYFQRGPHTEKQHEFGFKVGGPVYIPKIYNGKDKTFFFFNIDWYRLRGGTSNQTITLPTNAMKQGDFSGLVDSDPTHSLGINPCDGTSIQPGQIFDPLTTETVGGVLCRTAFPGNIIPSNRLSPLSAQYMGLMPDSATDAVVNNTPVVVPATPQNNLFWLIKADHNISHNLVFHGSYYIGRYNIPTSPTISGVLGSGNNFNVHAWEPRLSLDHTITPRLLNQVLFSVQYTEGQRVFFPLVPDSFNSSIATPGQPYPALVISGMPTFGTGQTNTGGSGGCWPCTFFADNLKWVKGRHNFAFGTELRWEDERNTFAINNGTFNFGSGLTSLPGSASSGQLGFGFASFYLGAIGQASRTGEAPTRLVKTGYRALYAQDDIRVSSKLTLNLGLRWDVSLPVYDNDNKFSTFDPTVPNPGAGGLLGSLVYAGNTGGPCIADGGASLCRSRIANTYYNNWQPRIGFAYGINDKTIVRGGFGITTIRGGASTLMGPEIAASYLSGYQFQETFSSPDNGFSPPAPLTPTWDVGLPPIGTAPPRTLDALNGQPIQYMRPEDGKSGYIQQWSLTVEQKLPWRIGTEVSYVGSSSVHIGSNLINKNQVPANFLSLGPVLNADINSPEAMAAGIPLPFPGFTGSVAQALRPYPQYRFIAATTQITGHANYHSLQMRAQKYFSEGLTFITSFTWSKTLLDGLDQFSNFSASPLDTYNPKLERQVLGANIFGGASPRTLSFASTYELPIGPGKRYLAGQGVVGKVVGGWGVAAVLAYNAGSPLPITGGTPTPIFNRQPAFNFNGSTDSGGARPNRVPGVKAQLFTGGTFNPWSGQRYLNPDAFSDAGAFALGNAPNTLPDVRGFPYYNENISIIKNTKVTESAVIQFRAEFFNAFNRTVFAAPNTNWSASAVGNPFGQVTGQANTPRQIQFALRVDF